jgi:hypothetical protein
LIISGGKIRNKKNNRRGNKLSEYTELREKEIIQVSQVP